MVSIYWDILKNKILANKKLLFCVTMTAVLCFGFAVSNFSIGIDDPAASHYLTADSTRSMIQQGRLLHVLYHFFTGSLEFLPFFNDFLGAFIFSFSSLLFCALFQLVTGNKISDTTMITFCCVYISCPIIHEKFIYNLDTVVTMSSYCTCALALVFSWFFIKYKRKSYFALATICLFFANSSYETFIFVYFCGVFALFILDYLYNGEAFCLKIFLIRGIQYALIAISALVIYYVVVFLVQIATGQYGVFQQSNVWIDREDEFFTILYDLIRGLYLEFRYSQYFSIREFVVFAIVGLLLFATLSIYKKNLGLILCYVPLLVGNILIHCIHGYVVYRTAQTFCFFISFIVLILIDNVPKKKWLGGIAVFFAVWLVIIQSAELNRWFYNDYIRSQKEAFVINTIATELVGNYDISKPIIFVNDNYYGYLNTYYYTGSQVNGSSAMYWACYAFGDNTTPMMRELFRMHGYDFLKEPTEMQATEAKLYSETMPAWPSDGYIQELEKYIVIKIG